MGDHMKVLTYFQKLTLWQYQNPWRKSFLTETFPRRGTFPQWCWKQSLSFDGAVSDNLHCLSKSTGYQQTACRWGLMETCLRIVPSNPIQQHSLSSLLHILQKRTAHFTERLPPPHWLLLPAIQCCPLKVSYLPALKVSCLWALKVPKEPTLEVSYYFINLQFHPTTRIPNSCTARHKKSGPPRVKWISGTERAIIDPLVSKRPVKISGKICKKKYKINNKFFLQKIKK